MSYNYTQQHPGHSFLVVPVKNQYGIMHASREICTGHTGFLMLLFLSSTSSSFGWGPETEFSASVSPFRSGLTWVVHQVRTRLPTPAQTPRAYQSSHGKPFGSTPVKLWTNWFLDWFLCFFSSQQFCPLWAARYFSHITCSPGLTQCCLWASLDTQSP